MTYAATPGILSQDTARPWGERVHEWRAQRGLSVEQVASILNVSRSIVHNWERGEREPSDTMRYVEKFRAAQEAAGEHPGTDPKDWVASIWKAHVRKQR